MKFFNTLIATLLLVPALSLAQAEQQFNGVALNESLATVEAKLKAISKSSKVISMEQPVFPLAKSNEQHLICTDLKTKTGTISKAVFTFADDQLSYIEAHGNVQQSLTAKLSDTASTYMDYEIYQKQQLFINSKKDIAWIMTPEAMHPNLFTWENPLLNKESEKALENTGVIPSFLKMGTSFEDIHQELEANSSFTVKETLDGSDPTAQYQINCFGVNYLGFPRKVEARFGNDKLNVVWILTAKGEEDRVRQALNKQYGPPIFTDDTWEVFNNWQVALRKDKPEVLLIEQQLGLAYKASYFKK